jgi:hypothetical protein
MGGYAVLMKIGRHKGKALEEYAQTPVQAAILGLQATIAACKQGFGGKRILDYAEKSLAELRAREAEQNRSNPLRGRRNPQDYWWYPHTREERHHRWSARFGHGAILSPTKPHPDKIGIRYRRDKRTERMIGLPDTNRQNPSLRCSVCHRLTPAGFRCRYGCRRPRK